MSDVRVILDVAGKAVELEGDAALVIVLKPEGNRVETSVGIRTSLALAPILVEVMEDQIRDLKEKILLHLAAATFASPAPATLN